MMSTVHDYQCHRGADALVCAECGAAYSDPHRRSCAFTPTLDERIDTYTTALRHLRTLPADAKDPRGEIVIGRYLNLLSAQVRARWDEANTTAGA